MIVYFHYLFWVDRKGYTLPFGVIVCVSMCVWCVAKACLYSIFIYIFVTARYSFFPSFSTEIVLPLKTSSFPIFHLFILCAVRGLQTSFPALKLWFHHYMLNCLQHFTMSLEFYGHSSLNQATEMMEGDPGLCAIFKDLIIVVLYGKLKP